MCVCDWWQQQQRFYARLTLSHSPPLPLSTLPAQHNVTLYFPLLMYVNYRGFHAEDLHFYLCYFTKSKKVQKSAKSEKVKSDFSLLHWKIFRKIVVATKSSKRRRVCCLSIYVDVAKLQRRRTGRLGLCNG